MRLDPASVKIQGVVGATFTVDVRIEGVTNLGASEFQVRFDDKSLDLIGIRAGPFLSSAGGDPVCTKSNFGRGVALFGCLLLRKEFAVDGSGTIAHIDFSLRVPFSAPQVELLLMGCGAADSQGNPIALNGCKDGIVDINAAPTPTPTPTPRPVGGIAFDPDVGALTNTAVPSRGGDAWVEIVLALASGLALFGGVWLVRPRSAR